MAAVHYLLGVIILLSYQRPVKFTLNYNLWRRQRVIRPTDADADRDDDGDVNDGDDDDGDDGGEVQNSWGSLGDMEETRPQNYN